jgi:hypothetical protein
MMPSGEGAAKWIKLVQARDEQCEAFVRDLPEEKGSTAVCLEIHRGDTWAVSIKAESNVTAALFRRFATVRAGHCLCPSGSAAYYELQVVHMNQCPQLGFCSEKFSTLFTLYHGVGDDCASWGVDGQRLLKWHRETGTAFGGRRWQDGDVIGLACDLRTDALASHIGQTNDSDTAGKSETESSSGGSIWVSLNGDFSAPYGLAFHLPQGLRGLFAAFSSTSGVVRCNLGEEPFKYVPPGEGFMPMCSFSKLT